MNILNCSIQTGNYMDIGFHSDAAHPDRISYTILSVNYKILRNNV